MLPDKTWEHVLTALGATPKVLARLIEPFPPDAPTWDVEVPGRFTCREHVAHMADWDEVFLARLMAALEDDTPTVLNPDETQMAADNGYRNSEPAERARLFAERRKRLIEALSAATKEQRQRPAVHPRHGRMTLEDQAVHVLGHDGYHLAFLAERLGITPSLPRERTDTTS